ncbi:MFS transporter [bacterium]|nr:MFS transporter [bacterium]
MSASRQPGLVRVDGAEITERAIRRGLNINIAAGSLAMVWMAGTLGIPLALMLQNLQASGTLIGFSTTVQQLAMLVQIPASFFTERLKTRKPVWLIASVIHRGLWFLPAALPFVIPDNWPLMARLIVWMIAVSSVLGQMVTPCWYSWMADLVPDHLSGRFWSRRLSIVMVPYLLAMVGTGLVLDAFPDPQQPGDSFLGFSIVFGIGALAGMADVLLHSLVPEPKPSPRSGALSPLHRVLAPLRRPDFRWLTFSFAVWSFGLGVLGPFGILLLKSDYHVGYLQLASLSVAASIGAILAGFQSGYVVDRLGARAYAAILMLLGPLTGLAWFALLDLPLDFRLPVLGAFSLPQPVVILFLTSLAGGALYSSLGICQMRLVTSIAPGEGRTMAMAVHWTIIGLTAAAGPLVGGILMDWSERHPVAWTLPSGTPFSFYHLLIVLHIVIAALLAAPMVLRISPRAGDLPFGQAFPRLWLGNPMRSVRNVYSIYAISAAVSPRDRAAAVRRLGRARTALALRDLIDKLDDPSFEVREEAVTALGHLAEPEAVDALLRKLRDPSNDLDAHVARALGRTASPTAVDALIEKLVGSDNNIVVAAARALGAIGDERATPALRELLQRASGPNVFAAAADALTKLGDLSAATALTDRLRTTDNALLKKSLRVSVADLLGRPGEFYKVLVRDTNARGVEVERLLEELVDGLGRRTPHLRETTSALEAAYERTELNAAAAALVRLADHCGQRAGDLHPTALPLDHQLAVAYVNLLRGPWSDGAGRDRREPLDLLLGLYLLVRTLPTG